MSAYVSIYLCIYAYICICMLLKLYMHDSKTSKVLIVRKGENKKGTSRECAEHLRYCTKSEPFFQVFPFYHGKDHYLKDYKESHR